VRETEGYKFLMTWHNETEVLPDATLTRTITKGLHLRAPFMPASSFGHLMRDNYEPIVKAELKLGVDPEQFSWVIVPLPSFTHEERNSLTLPRSIEIAQHYTQWFLDKQVVMWRAAFPDPGESALEAAHSRDQAYAPKCARNLAGMLSVADTCAMPFVAF
jgi:hypothetical protein